MLKLLQNRKIIYDFNLFHQIHLLNLFDLLINSQHLIYPLKKIDFFKFTLNLYHRK